MLHGIVMIKEDNVCKLFWDATNYNGKNNASDDLSSDLASDSSCVTLGKIIEFP